MEGIHLLMFFSVSTNMHDYYDQIFLVELEK